MPQRSIFPESMAFGELFASSTDRRPGLTKLNVFLFERPIANAIFQAFQCRFSRACETTEQGWSEVYHKWSWAQSACSNKRAFSPSSLGSKALLITATPASRRAMTIIEKSLSPCARSMRIRRKAAGTLRKSFVCVPREKGNISRVQSVAVL